MINLFIHVISVVTDVLAELRPAEILDSLPLEIMQLLLTIISAFAIMVTLTIVFIRKSRKMTLELKSKTEEIEQANHNLEKLNRELLEQKERIERERANSERLYGIMLASAEDGIILYNTDWSVKYANPAVYSVLGLDPGENGFHDIAGNKDMLHPDNSDFLEERKRSIEKNGYYEAEIRMKHKNGRYIVLATKMVEVKDDAGSPLGILYISHDITSIKETQTQLIIAKEKAEESNRLKSTFLANISHEIRTPLNSIVGFANLLNDPNTDQKIREEYVGYLNQNTEKLLQVITDIIDLSRLENNEIEIKYNPVRVNSILDYVDDYAAKLISRSGKDLKFTIDKGLNDGKDIIYSDDVWLKRVFRHLIDNAVKFTRAGSIELKSVLAGTSVMFTVKDTGIGISKENLKNIFEQFRQEEIGHHRTFEGLGVGLTMARKVIENMDGYLWVESEKGKGSEFFFTIPYRPVDVKAYSEPRKKEENIPAKDLWTGKTILVADDNIDILRYLNRVLSDTGINVIQAHSGMEAIDIAKTEDRIDLVLLDMQMPEMNGLEAMKEIRQLKGNIPIIAQTAFVFEEEKEDIIVAGCDACLLKPISQEKLLSVISEFLNRNS